MRNRLVWDAVAREKKAKSHGTATAYDELPPVGSWADQQRSNNKPERDDTAVRVEPWRTPSTSKKCQFTPCPVCRQHVLNLTKHLRKIHKMEAPPPVNAQRHANQKAVSPPAKQPSAARKTVAEWAADLKMPVGALLDHLRNTGMIKGADDVLTAKREFNLLRHFSALHSKGGVERPSTHKKADVKSATVQVNVGSKRVLVKRDAPTPLATPPRNLNGRNSNQDTTARLVPPNSRRKPQATPNNQQGTTSRDEELLAAEKKRRYVNWLSRPQRPARGEVIPLPAKKPLENGWLQLSREKQLQALKKFGIVAKTMDWRPKPKTTTRTRNKDLINPYTPLPIAHRETPEVLSLKTGNVAPDMGIKPPLVDRVLREAKAANVHPRRAKHG